MRFIYHEKSGGQFLKLEDEQYIHIFKVRRSNAKDELYFRNLKDDAVFTYKVLQIDRKNALCELVKTTKTRPQQTKDFQIAWSVIDPKVVEKTLPFLNEAGVKKLIFVYSEFSQRNFKIDVDRLRRVAINSCEQCGRDNLMEFEIYSSIEEFLKYYDDVAVVDFSQTKIGDLTTLPKTWFIGCEGGFGVEDRRKLSRFTSVGFYGENILRSENAVMAVSAKLFL